MRYRSADNQARVVLGSSVTQLISTTLSSKRITSSTDIRGLICWHCLLEMCFCKINF